ncbi:homocysteine S-methyltransferase family protein [Sinorhizobium meliloti]|uniref:homocysteine S-methyltransferase family protein n=1 Tax=Rhizobium meliloti TaxID=382 RepID=UPI00299D9F22
MPNWTKPPSSMTVTRRSSLYAEIAERLPGLRVVGGCCGSDMRHIKALIAAGV